MSTPRRPSGDEPKAPKKKKRRSWRWLGYTVLVLLGLFIGACGLVGTVVYKAYKTLPVYEDYDPNLTSVVYDNKGEKVYELADTENRTLVKLSDVPKPIQQALVATEDARFYDHFGVDLWRVGGAIWANFKYFLGMKGSQLEGASTITMQLSRNAFLTPDQNMMRKIQEALIAIQLERRFTKDEILERYLNQVSFGHQAAGIEAAAETYFSKHAKDLTLSEGALLVGILKGTSFYDPFVNMEGAMNRRATVLDQMVKYHYLDAAEAERLKNEQVVLNPAKVTPSSVKFTGDWYVDYVMEILTSPELSAKYGTPVLSDLDLYHKGLKIYTALDRDYQKTIDDKVKTMMQQATDQYSQTYKKNYAVPQAAVVVMNHQTGEVKALYGGLDHEKMRGFNRATDAYRQPGSTMKPVAAYLPAIDTLGWGPATVIDDSPPMLTPKKDNVWPEDYDLYFSGLKNMRYAVEQSINAMAVRTEMAVTPEVGIEYAHKLGLTSVSSKDDTNLAMTLGGITKGVTPLDMTAAYGVLGSLGMKVDPVVITKIVDKNGQVIFEASPKKQQVVSKDSTWLMVDVMKGALQRGTPAYESKGWHGWPAAGKTGTTETWQDAWFIGFTPEIVTGVWTGYDNNDMLPGVFGNIWTGAGPPTRIWTALMDQFVKQKPADWVRPAGVTAVEVCKDSGMLPSPLCPKNDIITDYFRRDHIPDKVDNILVQAKVVMQPWVDPKTNKPILDSKTKKPINKYYLWKDGCVGTPETLTLIKRPDTYAKHPTDPFNLGRYWPADWWKEVPTEYCTPVATPPGDPNGQPGTQPGQPGTQPPVTTPPGQPGTQPPVTPPPGQPGTQPPVTTPPGQPGTQPPGTTPPGQPGTQPPGTTPPGQPGTEPPGGTQPPETPKPPGSGG